MASTMTMPVSADAVGLADRRSRRCRAPKRGKKKIGKPAGCAAGSGLGALRLLLEASGRGEDSTCNSGGSTRRPQSAQSRPQSAHSAPSVVDRRSSYGAARRPASACTLGSRSWRNTWSSAPQHVAQYCSPLSVSGPLLRPRSAPSAPSRRERRLGLTMEVDPDATSWESLEASKVRVVSILDRLEYLKHLQDGLTDISTKQAEEMSASYKSHSRMQDALKQAGPRIDHLLDSQRHRMKNGETAARRLKEINRFVVGCEEQRLGQAGAEAARASAHSAYSDPSSLSNTNERFDFEVMSAASQARRSSRTPVLAVVGMVPYDLSTCRTEAGTEKEETAKEQNSDTMLVESAEAEADIERQTSDTCGKNAEVETGIEKHLSEIEVIAESFASTETGGLKDSGECNHEPRPFASGIDNVSTICGEDFKEAPRLEVADDGDNDVG